MGGDFAAAPLGGIIIISNGGNCFDVPKSSEAVRGAQRCAGTS